MDNNEFQLDDSVPVDAELMEAWLGGHKISLCSKTLHDIKKLIEHYKDIITPTENVVVEFPTDENMTPCASVDKKVVYIPTSLLEAGEVDDTIGAMIHELRHIEMSDSERQTWATCFGTVRKALDTLFIKRGDGGYESIHDIIFGSGDISFNDMMDTTVVKPNVAFLRQACKDVAFLLNAVEDVRIDSLTQPNLKKYITKGDEKAWVDFEKEYNRGTLSEDTLLNLCYRLLFHHKGFLSDNTIEKMFGDTSFILRSEPSDYTPVVLKEFSDVIRTHLEDMWKNFPEHEKQLMLTDSDDPTELYVNGLKTDSESVEGQIIDGNLRIKGRVGMDTNALEWEDKEVGRTVTAPLKEQGGQILRGLCDNRKKPKIVNQSLKNEIDAYDNIQIYYTEEDFGRNKKTEYGCVVYDAV